jgi:hypothetical protein
MLELKTCSVFDHIHLFNVRAMGPLHLRPLHELWPSCLRKEHISTFEEPGQDNDENTMEKKKVG